MGKTARIIDGKKISEELCDALKVQVDELKNQGIFPRIALINASDDPASEIYVTKKKKLAANVGIKSDIYKLHSGATEADISELIERLNNDKTVHAILLQAPLAPGLRLREMVDLISVDKDVDGLTTANQGRLALGEKGVVPCTPLGVLHLIKTVHEKTSGLHAVVIGRSQIVGRPLISLLLKADFSVTALHSRSENVAEICRTADVVITAVGKPKFFSADFVKPGATVIDVGINRVIDSSGNKKIVGDVDFDEVSKIAGAITPVPGGVGPMTVAYLMSNTIQLAERN